MLSLPSLTAVNSKGNIVSSPGKPGGGLELFFSSFVCGAETIYLSVQSLCSRVFSYLQFTLPSLLEQTSTIFLPSARNIYTCIHILREMVVAGLEPICGRFK